MPSFATTAAATVFALNHASCKDTTTRYLAAFLNDMTRSAGLVQEMIDGSEEHLQVSDKTVLAHLEFLTRINVMTDDKYPRPTTSETQNKPWCTKFSTSRQPQQSDGASILFRIQDTQSST